MAGRTDRSSLRRSQGLEADDLRDIATALNMRLRGAVASLASVLVTLKQRRMRRAGKVLLPNFLVTRFADVIVRILGSSRRWERGWGLSSVPGLAFCHPCCRGKKGQHTDK